VYNCPIARLPDCLLTFGRSVKNRQQEGNLRASRSVEVPCRFLTLKFLLCKNFTFVGNSGVPAADSTHGGILAIWRGFCQAEKAAFLILDNG